MNRRNILQVLGIGAATGIAGTESITAKAAAMDPEHFNHPNQYFHVPQPQLDVRGSAKQHAIADALEALAGELRKSARAEEARKELRDRKKNLVAEARARGIDNPQIDLPNPEPIDEVWAIKLETHSKLDGEWLGHQIVIDVELLHAS